MTVLEIALLIIGICLCIGSFFVSEKLTGNDRENIKKLTNDQIEEIIKDKIADAKVELEDKLSTAIDDALEDIDRKTDKETNDKIMQISEYSDNVLNSMGKTQNEVTFMYSMLNEKHEKVLDMEKKLSGLEDILVALDGSIAKKLDALRDRELEIQSMKEELEQAKKMAPAKEAAKEEPVSFEEALAKRYENEDAGEKQNDNLEILTLHDEGLSDVDIAKKLGRGLGEVKFVLGLYQEGR